MSEPIYECPHCSGTGRTDNGAECQFCHAPARTARAGAIDAPVTAEDFKDVKVYTSTRDLRIDPAVRRVILDIVNTSKNAGETLTTAAERLIKNSPEFKKAASKAGATA